MYSIKRGVGWGILIYVIAFFIYSVIFIAFKAPVNTLGNIIMLIIMAIVIWLVSGQLKIRTLGDGLLYGITLTIIAIILDFLITTRFTESYFSQWSAWLAYAETLLIPLIYSLISKENK